MTLDPQLQRVLAGLPAAGPERAAIDAGEIDGVMDYSTANVILFPAARRRDAHRRFDASETPLANRLLAGLERAAQRRLRIAFEPLTLRSGTVVHEARERIGYVHFPIDCTIALLAATDDGHSLATALVGYEGMIGLPLALGVTVSTVRTLVQTTGTVLRMTAARFQDALRQSKSLQNILHRYTAAELALARQTAACNSFHSAEERLARWLLMTSDRAPPGGFFLTQAGLASMLGVRRVTVTLAARALERQRLIAYKRGAMTVLNRPGLEAASCRCYTKIDRGSAGASPQLLF